MEKHLRAAKKIMVVTPGNRTVAHFKKGRTAFARCGNCGAKLNRPRLTSTEIRKIPKVQRRPERPFQNLCSACMREQMKMKLTNVNAVLTESKRLVR